MEMCGHANVAALWVLAKLRRLMADEVRTRRPARRPHPECGDIKTLIPMRDSERLQALITDIRMT